VLWIALLHPLLEVPVAQAEADLAAAAPAEEDSEVGAEGRGSFMIISAPM
jgi:hypothetical protein